MSTHALTRRSETADQSSLGRSLMVYRVQGFGFRVSGFGFRVRGLGERWMMIKQLSADFFFLRPICQKANTSASLQSLIQIQRKYKRNKKTID